MSEHHYPWKRYWCPREAGYSTQDSGYLADPEGEWGSAVNPSLISFDVLAQTPCLVLLGEPGIGKSTAIEVAQRDATVAASKGHDQVLTIDLRTGDSEDRLITKIFGNPTFRAWVEGTHDLHLFMDSLDECLLRVATVASLLLEEFPRYPIERLSLRIACRTAEWPPMLEDGLSQLWGKERIRVVELVPLRRVDVEAATIMRGVDVAAFMDEVRRREAVPLAIKPVTLEFLLNTFQSVGSAGRLPATQVELYAQGCRLLCTEANKSRRATKETGSLRPEQRLAVAGRIAALTLFANRFAVFTGIEGGERHSEMLTLDEIVGGTERVGSVLLEVTETAIQEVLGTGLFTARGPERMGWAHQTYAEYLAAWYLTTHGISTEQMLGLIRHADDPDRRLVPQLYETAAWLAGMIPEMFRALTETDPAVLLRSDVATADVQDREKLLLRLIDRIEAGAWHPSRRDDRHRYFKLDYSGMDTALRPVITDSARSADCRSFAIDVAEACKVIELQEELTIVALDQADRLEVRIEAAYAAGRIADAATRAWLWPLAFSQAGPDPQDELKGCGLKALWPGLISAAELFSLLSQPQSDLYGAYGYFLDFEILPHLSVADLPTALAWVVHQQVPLLSLHSTGKLANDILLLAWNNLEIPEVAVGFAAAALKRIHEHQSILESRPRNKEAEERDDDTNRRRQAIAAIVSYLADANDDEAVDDRAERFYLFQPLALPSDIPWLIGRLQTAPIQEQRGYARLIGHVFSWRTSEFMDDVINASMGSPVLTRELAWLLEPIRLDSLQAASLREHFEQEQKWEEERRSRPLLDPPPATRIIQYLDGFEDGDVSAWWKLNLDMTLEPDSTHYGSPLAFDLTAEPGWKAADEPTRARLVAAAAMYVQVHEPDLSKWYLTNTLYYPDAAGYRALHLLLLERPEALSQLPRETWQKWVPMILSFPAPNDGSKYEQHCRMVAIAASVVPVAVAETLMQLIDNEDAEKQQVFILGIAKYIWDHPFSEAILHKIRSGTLTAQNSVILLDELLKQDRPEIRAVQEEGIVYARSVVMAVLSGGDRAVALATASTLLLYAPDGSWPVIWPVVQANAEFGRDLFERLAHEDRWQGHLSQHLMEVQNADLYLWLAAQYPHAEDPRHSGVHHVGPRESVAEFRDSLLVHLQVRGTVAANLALARVAQERPDLPWIKRLLIEAQEMTRRKTWVPTTPEAFLKLIDLLHNSTRLAPSCRERR